MHKFSVGQTIRFSRDGTGPAARTGSYKIVRLLPAEHNDCQYRIKSVDDGHERVVKESQIG
ncbi:MAG: hypothetical protein IPK66_00750 [Rhodospirillales bacterium]|nr:hypothetical protein [Rhodospirillales bacterium]